MIRILLSAFVSAAIAAPVAFAEPGGGEGADAGEPSRDAADDTAAPACAPDDREPAAAVRATFRELVEVYGARLPGPAGSELVDRRVDRLLSRVVDAGAFARFVLRGIWERGDATQRALWRRALEGMLRARYLKGMRSPRGSALEIADVSRACDRADVAVVWKPGRGAREAEAVTMALIYRRDAWRVYDVTVDGASLGRTWRSRFQRVHADGGIAAIDRQMRLLDARYRASRADR